MVVLIQHPAPGGIDLLVALAGTTHAQSGIHVHVMTGHIQTNQALENNSPSRPSRAQKHQQARSCATIRHHVKHRSEGRRLVKVPRGVPIQGIQQARHTVQQRACARMQRHVVERSNREDDSRIPWKQSTYQNPYPEAIGYGQNLPMRLGANRNTFSFDSRFEDGDGDGDGDALFFFFDGVFTVPLPFGDDTSLSSD